MTDTDSAQPAGAAELVASITTAVRRLAELSRADAAMGSMVTVLDLLIAEGGPLIALGDLFGDGSDWLELFENDDAEIAAYRMDDAAQYVGDQLNTLNVVLGLIRPLAD